MRNWIALALFGCLLGAQSASAAPANWIEPRSLAIEHLLDSQGEDALRSFAAEHLAAALRSEYGSEASLFEFLDGLRREAGPVGGVGLMLDSSGGLELHVTNRAKKSVIAIGVDDSEPHRITKLELLSSEPREAGPSLTWSTLDAAFERASDDGFCGTVLAIRGGEIVLDKGYGFADPQQTHPITPKTLFAIGSTPIDFTHAAILLLRQRGKLQLSDLLSSYFPSVPEDKSSITLEHLRTGRSGLIDFPGIEGVDENLDLSWIDRDEFLSRVFAAPLLFEPGRDEQHSHCAWGVLAAVVEVVSGMDYEDFLRENFFEAAGMDRTGNYPWAKKFPASEVAVGLGGNRWGKINSPAYWGPTSWLVLGSGGMVSTARDLWKWRKLLAGSRVFNSDSQRLYGIGGVFVAEGGNDRGFINTIGARGDDLVIVCSNSQVGMDDATARLALAAAEFAAGD